MFALLVFPGQQLPHIWHFGGHTWGIIKLKTDVWAPRKQK